MSLLTKIQILEIVQEILVDKDSPAVTRIKAADLMLKDIYIAERVDLDGSDAANDFMDKLLGAAKHKEREVDILSHVKQLEESLSKEEMENGFGIREITARLEEEHNVPRAGNLEKTKKALTELGWNSMTINGRGRVWKKN